MKVESYSETFSRKLRVEKLNCHSSLSDRQI